MQSFRDLEVWEKAHRLALSVYRSTKSFPKTELYGLTSQMRRACVSVPSNIAEGCGRGGNIELARFLQISMGSASELEYQCLLAKDLGYLEHTDHERMENDVIEVRRMLASLRQRVLSGAPR